VRGRKERGNDNPKKLKTLKRTWSTIERGKVFGGSINVFTVRKRVEGPRGREKNFRTFFSTGTKNVTKMGRLTWEEG